MASSSSNSSDTFKLLTPAQSESEAPTQVNMMEFKEIFSLPPSSNARLIGSNVGHSVLEQPRPKTMIVDGVEYVPADKATKGGGIPTSAGSPIEPSKSLGSKATESLGPPEETLGLTTDCRVNEHVSEQPGHHTKYAEERIDEHFGEHFEKHFEGHAEVVGFLPPDLHCPAPVHTSCRYESTPVTLLVGISGVKFYVHAHVLDMSPVLKEMRQNMAILEDGYCLKLPDDNPSIFSQIVSYVYENEYRNKNTSDWFQYENIVEVYIMATKYKLVALKPQLLVQLGKNQDIRYFCSLALHIYKVYPNDKTFRDFFKTHIKTLFSGSGTHYSWVWEPQWLEVARLADNGGTFAIDLTTALFEDQEKTSINEPEVEQDCSDYDTDCGEGFPYDGVSLSSYDRQHAAYDETEEGPLSNEELGPRKTDEDKPLRSMVEETVRRAKGLEKQMENLSYRFASLEDEKACPGEAYQGPMFSRQRRLLPTVNPTALMRDWEAGLPNGFSGNMGRLAAELSTQRTVKNARTAVTLMASNARECDLDFPAGATIVDVVGIFPTVS